MNKTAGLAATRIAEQKRVACFTEASRAVDAAARDAQRSPLEHRQVQGGSDALIACLATRELCHGWEEARGRPHIVDRRYRRGIGLASAADGGSDVPLVVLVEAVVDMDTGVASVLRLTLAFATPAGAGTAPLRRAVEAGVVQGLVHALRASGEEPATWHGCGLAGAELLPSVYDMPHMEMVEVPLAGPPLMPEDVRDAAMNVAAAALTAALREATGLDSLMPPVLPAVLLAHIMAGAGTVDASYV
ncbi:hypothetical protein AncyloWKF20_18520 [Ancylobacter sp. WKF20]|uniref:hypothetical protein n=1 Tax=Ancylobacter sp. WKF20 TaxID=3039801 RepID=UPI0024340E8C|nr:hypothetical protein [Ancylobacter sp. WKF20]WGD29731.1 hypothetical protein AncyloWKF20_18520 [Ancylobacter sp. WKF20]